MAEEAAKRAVALKMVADTLEPVLGWHAVAALRFAIGSDPGGIMLVGKPANLLVKLETCVTPIPGALLGISDNIKEAEVVLKALQLHSPGLRCLKIGGKIMVLSFLRLVHDIFPDIEMVCFTDTLRLNFDKVGRSQRPTTLDSETEEDVLTKTLLWSALRYQSLIMPLCPTTIGAFTSVVAARTDLTCVGFSDVFDVPDFSCDEEECDTPDSSSISSSGSDDENVFAENDGENEFAVMSLRASFMLRLGRLKLYSSLAKYPMNEFYMSEDDENDTPDMLKYLPSICMARELHLGKAFSAHDSGCIGSVTPVGWPNLRSLHIYLGEYLGRSVACGELLHSVAHQLCDLKIMNLWLSCKNNTEDDAAVDTLLRAVRLGSIVSLQLHIDCRHNGVLTEEWTTAKDLILGLAKCDTLRTVELIGDVGRHPCVWQLFAGGRQVLISN